MQKGIYIQSEIIYITDMIFDIFSCEYHRHKWSLTFQGVEDSTENEGYWGKIAELWQTWFIYTPWQFRIQISTMTNWNELWQFVLVNPLAEVIDKLQKTDEANEFIQAYYLFLTVGEAVTSLSSAMKGQSSTMEEETQTIVTEH